MVEPLVLIAAAPVGAVIYGFSEEPAVNIDFLIREKSSVIAALPERPALTARAGAVQQDGVLLAAFLFSFDGGKTIYETFWDYYRQGPARPEDHIFHHMATQPELTFSFIGDGGEVETVIQMPHATQDFFKEALLRSCGLPPWTREEFDLLKSDLSAQFGTPADLWQQLSR